MPRKHRTPASTQLNRENQRRSRARHREFVGDLKRRLLEYELRGVQATANMQLASRAVAAENAALRALLAERGVSQSEIDAYLVSRLDSSSHGTGSPSLVKATPTASPPELGSCLSSQQLSGPPSVPCAASPKSGDTSFWQPPPEIVLSARCKEPEESGDIFHHSSGNEFHTPLGGPSLAGSSTVTRCEEAAAILARLRGRPDTISARTALGCFGARECHIKNIDLMQLMDRMT